MKWAALLDWRGERDDSALEPDAMQFKIRPGLSCRGCLFEKQAASVCVKAGVVAARAGLEDCERGFIYVAVPVDPRQLDITQGEKE